MLKILELKNNTILAIKYFFTILPKNEITMKKFLIIACIPISLLALAYALTFAFDLISAPSDSSVFFGFLILGIIFAVISYLLALLKRKYKL